MIADLIFEGREGRIDTWCRRWINTCQVLEVWDSMTQGRGMDLGNQMLHHQVKESTGWPLVSDGAGLQCLTFCLRKVWIKRSLSNPVWDDDSVEWLCREGLKYRHLQVFIGKKKHIKSRENSTVNIRVFTPYMIEDSVVSCVFLPRTLCPTPILFQIKFQTL